MRGTLYTWDADIGRGGWSYPSVYVSSPMEDGNVMLLYPVPDGNVWRYVYAVRDCPDGGREYAVTGACLILPPESVRKEQGRLTAALRKEYDNGMRLAVTKIRWDRFIPETLAAVRGTPRNARREKQAGSAADPAAKQVSGARTEHGDADRIPQRNYSMAELRELDDETLLSLSRLVVGSGARKGCYTALALRAQKVYQSRMGGMHSPAHWARDHAAVGKV